MLKFYRLHSLISTLRTFSLRAYSRRAFSFRTFSLRAFSLAFVLLSQLAVAQQDEDEPREDPMTVPQMRAIVLAYTDGVSGPDNYMVFSFEGVDLALISDSKSNRMRIISPVTPITELSQEQIIATLVSNYHLALDARYAIGDGLLYSTFIHPLKELTTAQLESAIRQVATLNKTFGEGYTSGEMSFGLRSRGQEI